MMRREEKEVSTHLIHPLSPSFSLSLPPSLSFPSSLSIFLDEKKMIQREKLVLSFFLSHLVYFSWGKKQMEKEIFIEMRERGERKKRERGRREGRREMKRGWRGRPASFCLTRNKNSLLPNCNRTSCHHHQNGNHNFRSNPIDKKYFSLSCLFLFLSLSLLLLSFFSHFFFLSFSLFLIQKKRVQWFIKSPIRILIGQFFLFF